MLASPINTARAGTAAVAIGAAVLTLLLIAGAGTAMATASPAVAWRIQDTPQPSNFQPADSNDTFLITLTNVGSQASNGRITVTDTLPPGVTTSGVTLNGHPTPYDGGHGEFVCTTGAGLSVVTCTSSLPVPALAQPFYDLAPNITQGNIGGGDFGAAIFIPVTVAPSAAGTLTNHVEASGGGATGTAAVDTPTPVTATALPFGPLDFSSGPVDPSGAPDTQAGDHPAALYTAFRLTSANVSRATGPHAEPVEDPRQVVIDLPAGLVGNPQAAPKCTEAQLQALNCPPAAQVGELGFTTAYEPQPGAEANLQVFNLVPERGYPAEFGVVEPVLQRTITLFASVRPGPDYGLQVVSQPLPQALEITGESAVFYGNPAQQDASPTSPIAFFTNPSDCSASGFTTTVHVDSYQHPGRFNPDGTPDFSDPNWKSAASTALPVTGCNQLRFNPTLSVQPDTGTPDSPAGVNVDLQVPQNNDPTALATPPLRDATVTLPQGVVVSPSAADGLLGCSDAQAAITSLSPSTCPLGSQIGTVDVTTPLLPDHLTGQIYLLAPQCDPCSAQDAASGRMLRGFLQAQGDGVLLKIPGSFSTNPFTGQLTAHFLDNPQFPFSDLKLAFKGGPRGLVATPSSCGSFTTTGDLSPWSGGAGGTADAFTQDSFQISGCGNPDMFSPSFIAGTANPQAGAFSPFLLSFAREDSDQIFLGLTAKLPPGLLAKLAGVGECSDTELAAAAANSGTSELANPSCPASSQVGTVTTGAGPGSEPFFLSGKAYLTGPYKGAPYGLAVVVPAVAGPFNLGTVVVRQALYVDPTTAQVTAVSDPFPTILAGIPLQIRRIDVDLNRPSFTVNPTSCDPMSVTGTLTSTGGLSAPVSSRFQVGGCQELSFSPELKMALTGKGKTRSADHPTLISTLTQPFGQANLHSAKVTLPLSIALDPNNSQHVCNYDAALAVHGGAVPCPASTIVGSAVANTPLLSQPLSGKVYLVQGIRFSHGIRIRTLPSLLVPLRGQIALDLRAQTSVDGESRLVTTFGAIPDAAVSKFTLTINGGPKGLLVITGRGRTICNSAQTTLATLAAQSGKNRNLSVRMATPCGKPARLTVLSHRVQGHTMLLRVRTLARGRVTVSAQDLRRFSRVLGTGVHRIRVGLKGGAHPAAVTVQVTLTPVNAHGASRTFRMRRYRAAAVLGARP